MALVKPITGPGITSRVSMELADLGIPRWDPQRQCNAVMFGDNFSFGWGEDWESPSIVMYDDMYNVLGIPTITGIASEGMRRQLWDYPHNNPEYSTLLPTDFIRVNNIWYVAVMVTAGLGNELRTAFWQSRNLVDWVKTEPYVALNHPSDPPRVMLTFDQIGDTIWIFSTGGLSRDKDIWLWSCPAATFPHGDWEQHGLVLPGRYGELCFRAVQGNSVLSFFDAGEYRQTALTVQNPTDNWGHANRCDYAHGHDFPQLYGGYITPGSKLNEPDGMEFLVSQWDTNDNDPYHVVLFHDTLAAQGPLAPTAPPVVIEPPVPPPAPPKDTPMTEPMTPQELYNLLLRELAASGSEPITTPEGDNLTLRQAVEQIFWKARGWHGLEGGRPRHPNVKDDQLGQILSMRAEGLFTQACVVALADKYDIDTAALFKRVRDSIS